MPNSVTWKQERLKEGESHIFAGVAENYHNGVFEPVGFPHLKLTDTVPVNS